MKFDDSDRMNMVEHVVNKRQSNLEYIRRMHEGGSFWLNTVKIDKSDISKFSDHLSQKRAQQLFFFGISVASLLHTANGTQYVRALAQLMEEFEYHYASNTTQHMMRLKARQELQSDIEGLPVRPSIIKKNRAVVYQYLQLPNVPCDLDYAQILFTLCDILILMYRKFVDPSSSSPSLHEGILRIDDKIKVHVISNISMDLAQVGQAVAQEQARLIDPVFGAAYEHATKSSGVKDMLSLFTGGS